MITFLLLAQMTTFDLSSWGWGLLSTPVAIQADGKVETQEWLIRQVFSNQSRIALVNPQGRICAGPWFTVTPEWTLQVVNGKHVMTRYLYPLFEMLSLDPYVPACP